MPARDPSSDAAAVKHDPQTPPHRQTPELPLISLALFAGLALLLVLPLFMAGNPPLVDYPNHLARMKIAFEPDADLLRYYQFGWRNMSNLGLELGVAGLSALMPVEAATQLFVGLVLVLSVGGAFALQYVLYRTPPLMAGVAAFFVWGGALQFGFLSYCLGVAFALWAVAGWLLLARRNIAVRLLYGAAVAVLLYYVHIIALGVYGLVVAGIELDTLLRPRPQNAQSFARRFGRGALTALQFGPAAVLFLGGAQDSGTATLHFMSLRAKLLFLQRLFWSDGLVVSALMLGVIALVLWLSLRQRRWPLHPALLPGILFLLVAYMLLPGGIIRGETPNWALDWRLLTPAALFTAAALRDPFTGPRDRAGFMGATVLLVAGRIGIMMTGPWAAAQATEAQVRQCFAGLERGESVMTFALPMGRDVYQWPEGSPPVRYLPAFAVLDRSAYIPQLFAYDNQQPLRYRPDWQGQRAGLESEGFGEAKDVNWPAVAAYDAVLVLFRQGADPAPLVQDLPLVLTPLCAGARFALYRQAK